MLPEFDKCLVRGRIHESCGGSIETLSRIEIPLGEHEHGDPVRCLKCGGRGEIFVDDGGVDFIWYRDEEREHA